MIILTIRTDNPTAEIGLYDDATQLSYKTWEAHRQLAETIHATVKQLLEDTKQQWQDVGGVVVFQGPGSFTGLRIGMSVANALAYANSIPIAGQMGDDWITEGIERLLHGESDKVVVPEYGAPVHITQQKR